MTLGNKIAYYRKKMSITQDALARQLGVTNQAVSKWESDQCCPDVMLLPKIAEIFGITVDELFGREPRKEETSGIGQGFDVPKDPMSEVENMIHTIISEEMMDNTADEPVDQSPNEKSRSGFEKMFGISLGELDEKANQQKRAEQPPMDGLPWEDDNVLRVAVYVGRKLVCGSTAKQGFEFDVKRDVDGILNSISGVTIICGNVDGDVDAGGDVTCDTVGGNVDAGGHVSCDCVGGDVDAGGNVSCDCVGGDVDAGASVTCGGVGGDVDAGASVACGDVGGDVDAGTDVKCGDISGDVDAGCNVECGNISGDVDACGVVKIR